MLQQRIAFLLSIFLFLNIPSFAATIKGFVYDKQSGEQMVGALVVLENTRYGTATELDGSYTIKNVPAGKYKLKVSFTSYETVEQEVTLADDHVTTVDIKLGVKAATLKEVQITGKYDKGSDEESQNKEKTGHEIMNIVSAHSIQFSPDITVSAVLQRVSGVSIENSHSGKQYAIIRGMDKKYNSTLVNGVKIPSPDDRDRFVPLDLFPAELLERLEVIKTLSPSMEGDGTGGVVNIVMKNAPDKPMFDANIGFGYSTMLQNQDFLNYAHNYQKWRSPIEISGPGVNASPGPGTFPMGSLVTYPINHPLNSLYGFTTGSRFCKNKLGLVVSGSYQNTYQSYNTIAYLQSSTVPPSPDRNTPLQQHFSDLYVRQYSTQSDRLGLMSKLDYEINDRTSLSLFATYIELDQYRVRHTSDSTLGGHSINGYTFYNEVDTKIETRSTMQNIASATLQGKHKFAENFLGDLSLVASQAKQQIPDDASFTIKMPVNIDGNNNVIIASPEVGKMSRNWFRNTDKDLSTYLNFHYSPNFLRGLKMIDFGGLYRHKDRDNYANSYSLEPSVTDKGTNNQPYTGNVMNNQYYFLNSRDPLGTTNDPGIYTYHEDIIDYYAQFNYDLGKKINLFGGLRVENTNGGYVSDLNPALPGKSANYVYTDFLPSVQFKYQLTEKSAIRAAYFRSLYRPAFGDLVPNIITTEYDEYDFIGNPYLKHTVIDNIDLRYELFTKGLDQLMVGVFNKVIDNPIEYQISRENQTTDAVEPFNFGTANNYGIELVFRKYFGNFGIAGNYTFTSSQITTWKQLYYFDTLRSKSQVYTDSVKQTRPLVGQAANVGNISLLYRNKRSKTEAQLAFNYTGERINLLSPYNNLDLWQKPTVGLDFSIQQQFGAHITLYVKANNLVNSGYELFIKGPNSAFTGDSKLRFQESANYTTVEKDFYKPSFLVGFKFKM